MVARHQRGHALHQLVPVTQEVEGQDRQQDQIGDPRHHREARTRQVAEERRRHAAGLLPVAAQPFHDPLRIQPGHQLQAGVLFDPGQRLLHEPVAILRQRFHQRHYLAFQHRHQDQQRQHQQQQHQGEHQHHRGRARASGAFQPIHPGIAQPAQQRRADEGGQHRRQQVDQPPHDGGDQQPLPTSRQGTDRGGGKIHADERPVGAEEVTSGGTPAVRLRRRSADRPRPACGGSRTGRRSVPDPVPGCRHWRAPA